MDELLEPKFDQVRFYIRRNRFSHETRTRI